MTTKKTKTIDIRLRGEDAAQFERYRQFVEAFLGLTVTNTNLVMMLVRRAENTALKSVNMPESE